MEILNLIEKRKNYDNTLVFSEYVLDTVIDYEDIECIVRALPEQHKYSFSLKNSEEGEAFVQTCQNKDELLSVYNDYLGLSNAETFSIHEKIGDKTYTYNICLNSYKCVMVTSTDAPEYTETLNLIEKAVMENKKKLI